MADDVGVSCLLSTHAGFFRKKEKPGSEPRREGLRWKFRWVPWGHRTVNTDEGPSSALLSTYYP